MLNLHLLSVIRIRKHTFLPFNTQIADIKQFVNTLVDNLVSVTVNATLPPNCGDMAPFDEITNTKGILFVPKESMKEYKKAVYWSDFLNMQEFEPDGVKNLKDEGVHIKTTSNGICVTGVTQGREVSFYSLNGNKLESCIVCGNSIHLNTTERVIIVKVGSQSLKVVR